MRPISSTGPLCMIVEVVGEIFMPYFMAQIIQQLQCRQSDDRFKPRMHDRNGAHRPCNDAWRSGRSLFRAPRLRSILRPTFATTFIKRCRPFPLPTSIGFPPDRLSQDFTKRRYPAAELCQYGAENGSARPRNDDRPLVMSIALEPKRLSMIFLVSMPVLLAAIFIITKWDFPVLQKCRPR